MLTWGWDFVSRPRTLRKHSTLFLEISDSFLWSSISGDQPTTSTTWPCWESFADAKQHSYATSISQQLASAHVYRQLTFCSPSGFVSSLLVQVYGWLSEDGTRRAGGSACCVYDLVLVDLLTGNVFRFHCRRVVIMKTRMMTMRLAALWLRCEFHIIFGWFAWRTACSFSLNAYVSMLRDTKFRYKHLHWNTAQDPKPSLFTLLTHIKFEAYLLSDSFWQIPKGSCG